MRRPISIKPRFVDIPISKYPAYECGAYLLSYLCFPKSEAIRERASARATACYLALNAMADKDKSWRLKEQLIRPIYLMYPRKIIDKYTPLMERKIKERIAAASVAVPLLCEGIDEASGSSQSAKSKHASITEGLEQLIPKIGISDVVNVSSRIWRPSLPVIHLAIATAMTVLKSPLSGSFYEVFSDEQIVRSVVKDAETYAFLVSIAPKLKKDSEALINFDLV